MFDLKSMQISWSNHEISRSLFIINDSAINDGSELLSGCDKVFSKELMMINY